MESKFTKWALFVGFLSFSMVVCVAFLIYDNEALFSYNISMGNRIFFFTPFIYFLSILFRGELRFKVIKITIGGIK